ncbi:MAG: tetratricopeptide repeat protein [Bacteroidota bacterium]
MNNKIYFKNLFIKYYQSLLITFICFFHASFLLAQDVQIGNEYFKNKEYNKAKTVYEKLAKKDQVANEIHPFYLETLRQLGDWKEAEKFVKKQIRNNKDNAIYHADLAELFLAQEKNEEAAKEFDKAITLAKIDERDSRELSNYFFTKAKSELAINTLLASREHFKNPLLYGDLLGRLFKATNNTAMMINEFLIFSESSANLDYFKTVIQDEIKTEKDLAILEKVLYEKVQKFPDRPFFTEVLISHLVNQKQFFKAFLQAKALDKRMKYEGSNVYELAFLARQNKDFVNAAKMFEYMVKEYPQNPEYPTARRLLVTCKEEAIKNVYPVDIQDIKLLIEEYDKLLKELGLNQKTIEAMKNKANLLAFYLDEKDSAVAVLQKAIKLGAGDLNFVSRCKLDMGDIQVLNSDFWEATLTYQQVEKAEKDNPTGYDAKLRNAKLNYYKGDFELAEDILNILKKATTREIANDAMDLSLLIRDNTGVDSTETAMKCYASTELLIFQNKYDAAIDSLTKIITKYSKDGLVDDALYKRANCYLKLSKTDLAVSDLNKIIEQFPFDVLGDDASFLLAVTLEEKMKDKEGAMKLYQDILKNYPGSIFVVESRNRYRVLRGDTIN